MNKKLVVLAILLLSLPIAMAYETRCGQIISNGNGVICQGQTSTIKTTLPTKEGNFYSAIDKLLYAKADCIALFKYATENKKAMAQVLIDMFKIDQSQYSKLFRAINRATGCKARLAEINGKRCAKWKNDSPECKN